MNKELPLGTSFLPFHFALLKKDGQHKGPYTAVHSLCKL